MRTRKVIYVVILTAFVLAGLAGVCSADCLAKCFLTGHPMAHGSEGEMPESHGCDDSMDYGKSVLPCAEGRSDDSGIPSSFDPNIHDVEIPESRIASTSISFEFLRRHVNASPVVTVSPLFILHLSLLC